MGIRDHAHPGKATRPRRSLHRKANQLILRVLFTPYHRPSATTADDSALPKAISRQDRGGDGSGRGAVSEDRNVNHGRREQKTRSASVKPTCSYYLALMLTFDRN